MGLFSPKKTIKVASVVYNMAGDEIIRPSFLKNVMFSAVISTHDLYLGETIVGQYLKGPGIRQRVFQNWCINRDYPGLPSFTLRNQFTVDSYVVAPEITVPGSPAGLICRVTETFITTGGFEVFADQYVYANYPDLVPTEYLSEYYVDTNEILIQFEGGGSELISAGIYDANKDFLVAYHYFYLDSDVAAPVDGPLETGFIDSGDLPDLTGFTLDSSVNTGIVTHTLDEYTYVHHDFSDATTDYDDTPSFTSGTEDFNGTLKTYSKTEYLGGDGISEGVVNRTTTIQIWEYRYINNSDAVDVNVVPRDDIAPGVTETITTTVNTQFLDPMWDYMITTQDETVGVQIGDPQIFIYEMGTGNAVLDALQTITAGSPDPEYFPLLPIRLNNVSILDPVYDSDTGNGLYKKASDAYRRMSGNQKFSKLVKEIEDNDNIGDIDYAYIQYGVSFNDNDMTAGRYAYDYISGLIPYQNTDQAYMEDFIVDVAAHAAYEVALVAWKVAQGDPGDPLYGTTKPVDVPLSPPTSTTIQLKCTDPLLESSDMRMNWLCILEDVFSGIGRTGAKRGDVWKEKGSPITYQYGQKWRPGGSSESGFFEPIINTIETTYIYRQVNAEPGFESYKKLTLYGMTHQNFIYKGKNVETTAHEALDDLKASGFLIPLHMPTLKNMGMVDLTQLAMSDTYLVFNCYKVFKTYWYQTFLGQLLIILLLVVASVIIAPASFAGVSGVFGTNLSVGLGLGLSGTAAIVAGAVANTLASIIISQALSAGAVAVFGEKWGALFGAVLGFAFSFGMAGGFNNLSSFFSPRVLLQFGNALASGMQGFASAEIAELAAKTETARLAFEKRKKEIEELSAELMGSDLSFNPMSLIDDINATGNESEILLYRPEDLDGFIQRTLMTGTDMVDLSIGFIENFATISLTLPED